MNFALTPIHSTIYSSRALNYEAVREQEIARERANARDYNEPSVGAAFTRGLKTGAKAVGNATVDTVVSTVTVGTVDNVQAFGAATAEDLANGYYVSYGMARVVTEGAVGVATGTAAGTLAKGGKLAQYGARGLTALDNVQQGLTIVRAGESIAQDGLNAGNGLTVVGGALGLGAQLKAGGIAAIEAVPRIAAEPNGKFYSTAFETRLNATSYPGVSRARHFQEANESLLRAIESDPRFAQSMRELGITLERTPTGLAPRTAPEGWTWHHAQEPGVLQLVPRSQHTPGSIFWNSLHPDGIGGYSIWGQ